jgi:Tfp pilus assembly protein PilF
LKRYEEALASYDRALTLQPDYPEALSNRGRTLHALKRFEEALSCHDRALTLRRDYAEALANQGLTLHELKQYEAALSCHDSALTVRPNFAEALYNRGNTLRELNSFDEALSSYNRALTLRHNYADAHFNEALCRLATGDFDRGWRKYEWRWDAEQTNQRRNFDRPLWLGSDEIAGKTILLHAEQGLGDTIQFCRYLPLVVERGAEVILEVQRPLQELMSDSFTSAAQIITQGAPLPDFDMHCPLLSLPMAFGTRLETIPSATPYLRASPQVAKNWNARLGSAGRPKIGLAWSGNLRHKNDHNRSMRLAALLPLLDVDATFVSLQYDVRADDTAILKARSELLHFGDELKGFSEPAALISNLDLVISVDSSVAHLAGALAKPVWVLLHFIPDWRWLHDREDSPWYPSARLFRQDDTRTWDSVIARVRAALYDFVRRPL